jgi:hypothetical protein
LGRPVWITNAKVYPAVNKGSDMLVQLISERRREIEAQDTGIRGHGQ